MNTKQKLEVMKRNEEANKRHVEEWKAKMEKLMNGDMQAVLVDVYGSGRASRVHVGHSLDAWYEVLGCQWVEMPRRWIGDKAFVIICDEEGTFRSDCKVSARNGNEVMLVGNLLVVADDETNPGEVRGLTDNTDSPCRTIHCGGEDEPLKATIEDLKYRISGIRKV